MPKESNAFFSLRDPQEVQVIFCFLRSEMPDSVIDTYKTKCQFLLSRKKSKGYLARVGNKWHLRKLASHSTALFSVFHACATCFSHTECPNLCLFKLDY